MSWDPFPDDPGGEPPPWEPPGAPTEPARRSHLEVQLPRLVARRVPVRGITPGPLGGVGRLRLADSTTFLVSPTEPGDLGKVLRALHNKHAIVLARWEHHEDRLLLTLSGVPGRFPVQLWLIGPDQPD
ncbi:hypothetical protein [Serinicoccus marinus]|uniref:hypothetical protein n=1 Tax=Serinicoccus marinus TaxID=247333 RepID=UPI0003B4258B|nr:hypothetical protein [Serinicoccus marinus]